MPIINKTTSTVQLQQNQYVRRQIVVRVNSLAVLFKFHWHWHWLADTRQYWIHWYCKCNGKGKCTQLLICGIVTEPAPEIGEGVNIPSPLSACFLQLVSINNSPYKTRVTIHVMAELWGAACRSGGRHNYLSM